MDITQIKSQIWKIGPIVLLVAGLIAAVYLVQTKQIFKSKAAVDESLPAQVELRKAFDLTDSNGNPLVCRTEGARYVCYTKTRNVKIMLNKDNLGAALQ